MTQRIVGSDWNDPLAFGAGDNSGVPFLIVGYGGSDIIVGGNGADQLLGEGHQLLNNDSPRARYVMDLAGNQVVNGLGGPAGFGEHVLPAGNAASVPDDITPVLAPQGLHIFGQFFTTVYVNQFGGITLGAPLTGDPATLGAGNPVIAPYWSNVDTSAGPLPADAAALQSGNSMGTNRVYYDLDVPNGIFTVTWDDVGNASSQADPQFATNAFQLQLVDNGRNASPASRGDFDIVLRYEDMNWRFAPDDPVGGQMGYYSGSPSDSPYLLAQPVEPADIPRAANNEGTPGVDTFEVFNSGPWAGIRAPQPLRAPSDRGAPHGPTWYDKDFLTGGRGDDLLVGGGGVDVAIFH